MRVVKNAQPSGGPLILRWGWVLFPYINQPPALSGHSSSVPPHHWVIDASGCACVSYPRRACWLGFEKDTSSSAGSLFGLQLNWQPADLLSDEPKRVCRTGHVLLTCLPQSDAGLPDHLRPQVFGRQLKGSLQETQLLREALELSRPRQHERADLLELQSKEETVSSVFQRWVGASTGGLSGTLTAATRSSQSCLSSDSTSLILVSWSSSSRLE